MSSIISCPFVFFLSMSSRNNLYHAKSILFSMLESESPTYTSVYALAALVRSNGTVLKQMIYPEATRYGCWVEGVRKQSNCYVEGVCLFDKKAPDYFDIEKIGDKQKCRIGHDEDCDYVTPATCQYPLCYIKEN